MKILHLDEVEIKVYKSALARKITISIRSKNHVRITIPRYVSYSEAERFAVEKFGWIKTTLSKFENRNEYNEYVEGLVTKKHSLVYDETEENVLKTIVRNERIIVRYNDKYERKSKEVLALVESGIIKALKKEAKEFLPNRVMYLSEKYQLPFSSLSIKNMKSRWGSCSSKNKINLTIHLMRLPEHLIDYVILHELAHTKNHNHNKEFWLFLNSICPNAKHLDKELKSHRIMPL